MIKIHLPQVSSTNSWLLEQLSDGKEIEEGTVVYTTHQTHGRGQVGNTWESEPDKNITFSLLLHPLFLPINKQFTLSELCCLGVIDGLKSLCRQVGEGEKAETHLCIKWPNDIYWDDEKLGGILIENRLMGAAFSDCVLGIGLNVNQEKWLGNAPNPTSLLLKGLSFSPNEVLEEVADGILKRYYDLIDHVEEATIHIHSEFVKNLYRSDGYYQYEDAQTHEVFEAMVENVDPRGPVLLKLNTGECRKYWFKEVRFILPCGITKE